MKKIVCTLIIFGMISLSFNTLSKSGVLPWQSDFDKALVLSKQSKKPVFLFFTGSDWCSPCKMLENDFMETEEFKNVAKNKLILYKVDFPRRLDLITPEQRKQNAILKSKYGVKGYPTIVVVDSNGKVIDRQVGYNRMAGTEEHYKLLYRVSKK